SFCFSTHDNIPISHLYFALFSSHDSAPLRGHAATIAALLLRRLVAMAISDLDPTVRSEVLKSIDPQLDPILAQQEFLEMLFIVLHDEVFQIRDQALALSTRVSFSFSICSIA